MAGRSRRRNTLVIPQAGHALDWGTNDEASRADG